MWICKNCKEKVDLEFDVCWNCGVQDLNKDLCSESENLIEFENENKELLDTISDKKLTEEVYEVAINLLVNNKRDVQEVHDILIKDYYPKVDTNIANRIISEIQHDYQEDTEEPSGNKNMFWGAIWCVGGIIFTVSDTGYIWWGAILFGGIQFFQGLIQSSSSNKD